MKVLNLRCAAQHQFEGWFACEADYLEQLERGLVECPLCGDKTVQRMPSAPHVLSASSRALSAPREARERAAAQASSVAPAAAPAVEVASEVVSAAMPSGAEQLNLQSAWLRAVAHVIKNTDDVGTQFAEEARRIHYGEASDRAIRGQASADDAAALLDEGIEVMAIPMPAALKSTLQ